ncbi:hypothetical protein FDP41_005361 [Naegleria fowleri]|uniref:DUF4116 domain-containing protein n=1 Tax=Naegleria fowleri TaxID=5763 RepID=A0A6A5BE82_NAEFO|nr:uncharacterized protein FDP41_005361 [Naegleria fowleri]KAF0975367.1 hypothetical protein FDP41_005361 [Naegleria fowleri]
MSKRKQYHVDHSNDCHSKLEINEQENGASEVKKIKLIHPNQNARMIMIDFSNSFSHHTESVDEIRGLELSLKKKFLLQQEGKKKWLLNRELKYEHFFPVEFMNDKEFILNHIKKYGYGFGFMASKLRQDRNFVLQAAQLEGGVLNYYKEDSLNDKEVVLEALKTKKGFSLESASPELLKDNNFVMEAIRLNEKSVWYASEKLWKDRELVFEAIKQNKKALQWVSHTLRDDKEFVLKALQLLYPEFENFVSISDANKEIMLKVVKDFGFLLKFASEELKNDRDVVCTALKSDYTSLEFASLDLQNDIEIALEETKRNGYALKYVSPQLKKTKDVVLTAVNQNGYALAYASDEMKKDREVVLAAVRKEGRALQYADKKLQKDQEIIFEAIKQDQSVFPYISHHLFYKDCSYWEYLNCERKHKELILKLAKLGVERLFRYIPNKFTEDRELVKKVANINGLSVVGLCHYSPLRNDKEIILEAVKNNGVALKFVSEELQKDPELVMEALKRNGFALDFSDELYQERMRHFYHDACLGKQQHSPQNCMSESKKHCDFLFLERRFREE